MVTQPGRCGTHWDSSERHRHGQQTLASVTAASLSVTVAWSAKTLGPTKPPARWAKPGQSVQVFNIAWGQALHARPDWLQQQLLHICGRGQPCHHCRPKLDRRGLNEHRLERDGAQIVVEIVPLAAVQRIAALPDAWATPFRTQPVRFQAPHSPKQQKKECKEHGGGTATFQSHSCIPEPVIISPPRSLHSFFCSLVSAHPYHPAPVWREDQRLQILERGLVSASVARTEDIREDGPLVLEINAKGNLANGPIHAGRKNRIVRQVVWSDWLDINSPDTAPRRNVGRSNHRSLPVSLCRLVNPQLRWWRSELRSVVTT